MDDRKLQIDDDWKSEAQAEKERLAQLEKEETRRPGRAAGGMPEPGFPEVIQLLAMQAMVGLGGMRGPGGQDIPPNVDLAKHYIDLLGVLESKTKGNLSEEERVMLDSTLHQLRMAYVEVVSGGGGPPAGMPKGG